MKQGIVALALALGVAACSASDIPFMGDATPDRGMAVADAPDRGDNIRGDKDPAVVTLDLKSAFRERRLSSTDQLPGHIKVPRTNLNAVPVTAALQAVLSGTDVSLSWNAGTLGSRLVTVMNLQGPLPSVVDRICSAAKVFCSYRHGSIELTERETFVVTLPPVIRNITSPSVENVSSSTSTTNTFAASSSSNTTNSIVEAINSLLDGEKATVDDQGGTIVYTATVDVEERVAQYLAELRTERPLVVMQFYIWEVTLNQENAQGINWSKFENNSLKSQKFSLTDNLSTSTATAGSVSLGAVTSGIISSNTVATFLASKGRVQTISNPQITFVSGSGASLVVGGKQKYISQVGTLTASNTSGTTTSSSSNTISTEELQTGLAMAVAGSYENGVVFANLEVSIQTLVGLNPTQSGGLTIDLPETTQEKINTVLRVRPGDSLVLAGLVSSDNNGTTQGFPTGSSSALPLYGDEKRENRELVIIVKPSIVLFADKSEGTRIKAKGSSSLPEPIVIDKDGSRSFSSQPTRRLQPVVPTRQPKSPDRGENADQLSDEYVEGEAISSSPVAQPEASATRTPESIRPVSGAPVSFGQVSDSDAVMSGPPVSSQPVQKGFSHAFDKMLPPSSTSGSAGDGQ